MDRSNPGCGRGGRGALLYAALKNAPRQPGAQPSQLSQQNDEPKPIVEAAKAAEPSVPKPFVFGRGAILQSLTSSVDRFKTPQPISESASASSEGQKNVFSIQPGFGRGAMGHGVLQSLTSVSPPPPPAEQKVPTPLKSSSMTRQTDTPSSFTTESSSIFTSQMEELNIKEYHGSSGKTLDMEVNYVRLKVKEGMGMFEYHIDFSPPIDNKRLAFKLMSQPNVVNIIGSVKSFDGAKLYIPVKLQNNIINIDSVLPTDNTPVNITIKYTGVSDARSRIQLYNIQLRKVMRILKMSQIGRNYFDHKGGIEVPQHKLEVWPGYVTSIHDFEGGVMLNCDASFRVLRSVTAKDILCEIVESGQRNFKELAIKALIGCVGLTRYNNKTYRIDDIAWNENPHSTFEFHSGQQMTYLEYYKRFYDIQISDEKQPLLVHKPKIKADMKKRPKLDFICLIPELTYLTGLTDAMRSDFKVMRDIATHTRITPEQRKFTLLKYVNNVNRNHEAKKALSDWGLELESALVSFSGRLLDREKIYFRNSQFEESETADWSRQAAENACLQPVSLESWVIIYTTRDSSKVNDFIKMMERVCPSLGMTVNAPQRAEIPNDRTENYLKCLKDKVRPRVQMAVIIFPTLRDDRYSAVKKLCCVDMPVPSQVINTKTISTYQKLRSVTQKIALQINCKLGGELWSVHIPMKNIMVCGIDSYHDTSGAKKSVLGFVASTNNSLTRWYSMTAFQSPGQELGDCLQRAVTCSLKKYHDVNHTLPDKIFVYRDGVGDGQMQHVTNYEVEQLSACFNNFDGNYRPGLTVTVVQKRINTRIFHAMRKNGKGMLQNPPPGSVVDHTVTRKNWYDFFLVSQHVRQGTVTPTHYVVVYDKNHMKPDHMQKLSYKLTHLYYNWPGTVRVPAPCQYAHRLAFLVGQNLHREPNEHLSDKLFYL